jgi:hypothetical protein
MTRSFRQEMSHFLATKLSVTLTAQLHSVMGPQELSPSAEQLSLTVSISSLVKCCLIRGLQRALLLSNHILWIRQALLSVSGYPSSHGNSHPFLVIKVAYETIVEIIPASTRPTPISIGTFFVFMFAKRCSYSSAPSLHVQGM